MFPKFSRRETVVLLGLIALLAGINVASHISRRRLERSLALVVEEGAERISLNNADLADLDGLPGIGPSLAGRIIEYRDSRGGYRSLDELKEVKGIGDRLFQRILPFIKL